MADSTVNKEEPPKQEPAKQPEPASDPEEDDLSDLDGSAPFTYTVIAANRPSRRPR
jgi:hypothetical protein